MKPRSKARRASRQPRPPAQTSRTEASRTEASRTGAGADPAKTELLEHELEGRALRNSVVLCDSVIVTFRYARRPVVVRVPGSAAAYRTTRPRAETTVRFAGLVDAALERELRWLLAPTHGARGGAPAAHGGGAPRGGGRSGGAARAGAPRGGGARLDIVLADGRCFPGCGIDVPLEDGGELSALNFRLRHRAL